MGGSDTENRSGGVSIVGVVACFVIALAVASVVFPMFARPTGGQHANCQSNMSQIGRALKMYLSEWHDVYPPNRVYLPNGKPGRIAAHVKLTPFGQTNPDGTPRRFQYGVSWVEALYPYVEAISKDSEGAWICGAASEKTYPEHSATAAVSYVMNRNMIERPEKCIRAAANLMMAREMDRKVDSELRPTNYSCGLPDSPPDSPFLAARDSRIGSTYAKMHNMGSNVLFADSHVKNYSTEFLPDQRRITESKCWDAKDRQWYNSVDVRDRKTYKAIAITP